jgi:hypothetical protein
MTQRVGRTSWRHTLMSSKCRKSSSAISALAGSQDCKQHLNNWSLAVIDPKTKRVTIPVSKDIDLIRDRLASDTGIIMSYSQIFNFLIHFYVERANEPKSKWKSLQSK